MTYNEQKEQNNEYYFPEGIPGFEDIKKFKLIYEGDGSLAQLVSCEDESIGFVLMNPESSFPGYRIDVNITEESWSTLGVEIPAEAEQSKLLLWIILKLNHNDITKTTGNFKAPIVLNPQRHLGIQLILNTEHYNSRQPIFGKADSEPEKEANDKC